MIDSRYDEDLSENSFFKDLKTEYSDLIDRATREDWIVCVPRADSFQRSSLTQDDFLTHILVPNDELPETHYRTLSGKQVNVLNKVITVETEDLAASLCTHIIFEEIFYTENLSKFKVWCIECPLNRSTFQYDSQNGSYNSVLTFRDCIDLLWTESLGKGILEQLDSIIEEFLVKNKHLEKCNLQTQKDLVCTLYAKCLQTTLKDGRLRERTTQNKHLLDNVKVSVESYMHHGIYNKLFTSVSVCTALDDSSFNKIVRNLYDIQLRDLNIKPDFYETIPCAKRELAKINGYRTILGKVGCLRHTLAEISNLTQAKFVSADDLLPVFIFLVLKTNIPNWIANLVFLKQFQFSSLSSVDELSFLVTTLEAAIEHVRSGMLLGPTEPESELFENENTVKQNVDTTDKLCEDGNSVAYFFSQVRIGNYDEVRRILENSGSEVSDRTNTKELCHPLCSCDRCERLLSQNICSTTPTVHSCDDRGFTAMHVACMYGKPKIVELLLEFQANIESCDYSGATPLHYAAMRGHQNALLLLLHSGADVNAVDSERSTALHFCCNNGHETCVQALLYFCEHRACGINVNCTNALGNTPLHYASRWGYESIVQILLEYGADPNIENKHKKSSLDCAHNLNIYHVIKNAKLCSNPKGKIEVKPICFKSEQDNKSDLDFVDEDKARTSPVKDQHGFKPRTTQEMKKAELLLRAVAYGDVPLIRYYLGLPVLDDYKNVAGNVSDLCHPLCNCEKCEFVENSCNESQDMQDINVCNSEGFTALHVSSLHGRTDIVRLLLTNGALPNIVTRKGLSALHLACQTQRLEIVKLLLQCKDCNVNIQDARGNTPLHYACCSKDQRIAEKLVAQGAHVQLQNVNGKSALDEAEDKMLFSLVKVLRGDVQIEVDQ